MQLNQLKLNSIKSGLLPGSYFIPKHIVSGTTEWWYTCNALTWLYFLRKTKKICGVREKKQKIRRNVTKRCVISSTECILAKLGSDPNSRLLCCTCGN